MNLEMIIASKRQALQQRKAKTPIDAVRALASMQRRPQPILSTVGAHVTLIGQVKHDPWIMVGSAILMGYVIGSLNRGDLFAMHHARTQARGSCGLESPTSVSPVS